MVLHMKTQARAAADLLRTLGDETRLEILLLLRRREFCVCELVDLFPISQPAVSGHLRRLRDAGLVEDERRGMWVYYRARGDLPALARAVLDAVALPPGLEPACAGPQDAACAAPPEDGAAPAGGRPRGRAAGGPPPGRRRPVPR